MSKNFTLRVSIAQNRYLKGERNYPVDYIKKIPKVEETAEMLSAITRKNLLKNVVMRIVNETRERKRRPKLGEVIAVYRTGMHEPNAKE